MTSWANMRVIPVKKTDPVISSYYECPSGEYAASTYGFLMALAYSQRTAEPFYISDVHGFFQPLLTFSPILHYLKNPSSGKNRYLYMNEMASLLNNLSFQTIKRTIQPIFKYNPETIGKIERFLTPTNIKKQTFDIGIVLDISGCVPSIISNVKQFQRRTGKSKLSIFVMTDDMALLQDFAKKGDPSWNFVSLMRYDEPQDKSYRLMKTLTELYVMKQIDYLAVKLGTPLGKLLYLTSEKINNEGQIVAIDGASWKAV